MNMQSQSTLEGVRTGPDGTADTMSFEGALLGQGVVVVWNDVAQEGRDQFYAWHDKQHMPERLELPGFRRGRRFASPGHSPEWLTMKVITPELPHLSGKATIAYPAIMLPLIMKLY